MRNLLLFFIGFLSLFVSCTIQTESALKNKIMVTGSAEMNIVPNEIYVVFTLSEYKDKNNKKVEIEGVKGEFIETCLSAGVMIKDIELSSYAGSHEWDYYYWRRKKEGDFLATVSYSVKLNKIKKLDKIVNKLNGKSIQHFYIERTTHSDIKKFRRKVKEKAVIASRNKARYLVGSIGQEIGSAILIEEINSDDLSDVGYYNLNKRDYYSNSIASVSEFNNSASSTPSIQKIKLRYEIRAEFEILEK